MRKYTFTLTESLEYEIGIDALSEAEAQEELNKMDEDTIRKKGVKIQVSEMELNGIIKGDPFEKKISSRKKKKK